MELKDNEKRALEIYIALLIQSMRKENNKALEHIRAFFYSFSYLDNYSPELLYNICIDNIEIIDKIPTHIEILLASTLKTNGFKFEFKTFKPYYRKRLTNMQLRQQNFSINQLTLLPKINNKQFHEHLLTFLKNFVILGKNIPIEEKPNVK